MAYSLLALDLAGNSWPQAGPMQNTQYVNPLGVATSPGSVVGGAQALVFRNDLDARRSMMGQRIPAAQYPDGYLGTIQSRRNDRLLNAVKTRLTQRSYQRGVHKGEKVDLQDYFWTPEFHPGSGIERESQAVPSPDGYMVTRQVPFQTVLERLMADDQLPMSAQGMPRGSQSLVGEQYPARGDAEASLRYLRPPWTP